ncbi:SHOCT domain-containing protein [Clostridium paraputrificum]|uniref:SHOCT domain-containing protein n=1 Tax=Clostridium paraputrificum TaxID=29363 RepID=UPI00356A2315
MNITELKPGTPMAAELPKTTDAELQNEYNYILAENFTQKLLEKGLISVDEFNKIMEKNKAVFSPFFARI